MGNIQEVKDRLTALEKVVFAKPEKSEAEPKPKTSKKSKKKEGK